MNEQKSVTIIEFVVSVNESPNLIWGHWGVRQVNLPAKIGLVKKGELVAESSPYHNSPKVGYIPEHSDALAVEFDDEMVYDPAVIVADIFGNLWKREGNDFFYLASCLDN